MTKRNKKLESETLGMNSINALTLQHKIDNKEIFSLIDVRESWEHEAFNIGGNLIPLASIFQNIDSIPKNQLVIFYCEKGIRSAIAIQRLQQKYGYTNLVNLNGGMLAWKKYFKL